MRLNEDEVFRSPGTEMVGAAGFEPATLRPPVADAEAKTAENKLDPQSRTDEQERLETPAGQSTGQTSERADPDAKLLAAIDRASAAEQWGVVADLGAELRARRLERAGIADLTTEKARRRS